MRQDDMDPKILDGKVVIHKSYGKGVVQKVDDKYLVVEFSEIGKKCTFQFPGAFYGYLCLENERLQKRMDSVIEIWKEENDIALKEKLKERYIKNQLAMEARRKATELKKQKSLQRMIDLRSHQNNSFSKKTQW